MMMSYEEGYEFLDEQNENAYNMNIIRAVLMDKIQHTYNARDLSLVAKQLFGYDNEIVRWHDCDGLGIAYNKQSDKIQEHLAEMTRRDL